MGHIDGCLVPVPRARLEDYRAHAAEALAVWREHGALMAVEAVEDDVPEGVVTSFPMAVKRAPDKVVVFSFIACRDRAHRDAVGTGVFADPRMQADRSTLPFAGRRMIRGGFRPIGAA